jgi:hypothetical protein
MMTTWTFQPQHSIDEDLNFSQLPYGMMRQLIPALLAAPIALASQTVFSVHDDLLAYPQVRISGICLLDS